MVSAEDLKTLQMNRDITSGLDSGFENEAHKFAGFLLEGNIKHAPKFIQENFWVFFDNELALSRMDANQVAIIMCELDIARLNYKMSIPDYELTNQDIISLDAIRAKTFARLLRSTGDMQRERALQATQIRQFLTDGDSGGSKGGIIGKITGALRGK